MASTPFLMIFAGRLAVKKAAKDIQLDDPRLAAQANVIIVGHGRFGQNVAQIMQAAGRSVTLIDINPEMIDVASEFGRKVFYGDGTRIDLLQRAGADKACAIFFCIDDRDLTAETLMPVRQTFPKTGIFARAYDRRQTMELMPDSDIGIVREVFESSVKMAVMGLDSLGIEKDRIKTIVTEFRTRDRARLNAQFQTGDMHAGQHHSFGGDDSEDFLIDQA
jgi:glutathione-regulated potassium-efflux system protein KefB